MGMSKEQKKVYNSAFNNSKKKTVKARMADADAAVKNMGAKKKAPTLRSLAKKRKEQLDKYASGGQVKPRGWGCARSPRKR